jgi:hypothetical protein
VGCIVKPHVLAHRAFYTIHVGKSFFTGRALFKSTVYLPDSIARTGGSKTGKGKGEARGDGCKGGVLSGLEGMAGKGMTEVGVAGNSVEGMAATSSHQAAEFACFWQVPQRCYLYVWLR